MCSINKTPARVLGISLLMAGGAFATPEGNVLTESGVDTLREELRQLKQEYEQRIQALEQRVEAAERIAASAAPAPASAPMPVATAGSSAISDKAFNPAISLILNGQYSSHSNHQELRDVPGFQQGGEASGFGEGFELNESELNLQANIDDKFFANSTIALESEGGETEVAVEEAFLQTLTLPAGLTLKGGKFYSGVGYINGIHSHATSFVGDPLAYRVMMNGRLADTGVQMSWTAPTILYMQFGAELFAGNSFPASGAAKDGTGSWTAFAKFGGDVDDSNSWLASFSHVSADAIDRSSGGEAQEDGPDPLFTGDSDTWIASLVWKWAPHGNPRERHFKLAAEYLSRREDGILALDNLMTTYRGDQAGYYIEGVYQYRPQWSVGLRYDALSADNSVNSALVPTMLAEDSFRPERFSAMIDFSNSEFSTLRMQFTRDESNPVSDNQLILQYIMSMGAHGAHAF